MVKLGYGLYIDEKIVCIIRTENQKQLKYLKGNIHNIFFDGCLHLNKPEIEQLFSDENLINKSLRIIYSYSDDAYDIIYLINQKTRRKHHEKI